MKKNMQKICNQKVIPDPLLIFANNPKQPLYAKNSFYKSDIFKENYQKALKKLIMSPVCHSYVLVCHLHVTRLYSYVIRMSLDVLVCHLYVTRLWFYHEPYFYIKRYPKSNIKKTFTFLNQH